MRDKLILRRSEALKLPFFKKFDTLFNSISKQNDDSELSYVIWGGIAINLLLQHLKITKIFYSYHDIELFMIRNSKIVLPNDIITKLEAELSNNENFGLQIGGLKIIKKFNPVDLNEFQNNRINNQDGDLEINNIVMVANANQIYFDGPKNTLIRLKRGEFNLRMKNHENLQTLSRISRRIYRTTSKLFRLFEISALKADLTTDHNIRKLIHTFSELILENMLLTNSTNENAIWLDERDITSIDKGIRWLYVFTMTEVIKRIAGICDTDISTDEKFNLYFFLKNSINPKIIKCNYLSIIEREYINYTNSKIMLTTKEMFSVRNEFLQYQIGINNNLKKSYSLDEIKR